MWIALAIGGAAVLAAVAYLALLPGRFELCRSLEIAAPVETVFAAVVDLRSWPFWNPWLLHEPEAELAFSDDYQHEAGYYEWDGALIGAGRLTHTRIATNRSIQQALAFRRPYRTSSRVSWTFEPRDRHCQVSWEMAGRMPFLFRFMIRSMVPLIERDYDLGLAMLQGYVNAAAPHPSLHFAGEESLDDFSYWSIPFQGKLRQLEATRRADIDALETASEGRSGLPLTLFHRLEPNARSYQAEIAIPIADSAPRSNYTTRQFRGGRYFKLSMHGEHQFLPLGWHALFGHCRMRRIRHDQSRPALEIYLDDPDRADNRNEIGTALYLPIR